MTTLKEECLLKIANETIRSDDMVEPFRTMGKQVVNFISNDVINRRDKALIKAETFDEDASALIKEALLKSIVPQKMDIFLKELEKVDDREHARKIRVVYKRYTTDHSCVLCGLPTPPEDEPGEREEEASYYS